MVMSQKLEGMAKVKHVQSNSELHCILQKKKRQHFFFGKLLKRLTLKNNKQESTSWDGKKKTIRMKSTVCFKNKQSSLNLCQICVSVISKTMQNILKMPLSS